MNIISSDERNIIEPCELEDFNYQIDPYIGCEHRCHYCYIQNRLDWKDEIRIYENLKEKLSEELASIKTQKIYMGMNTDPYQPSEEDCKQTRKVLEVLNERGFSVSILTKSNLVLRDIDILKKMSGSSIGISISFQDDVDRKLFEANTMSNENRVLAVKKLKKEGIETYALICPVMPFITDVEVLIDEVRPFVDSIWINPLSIGSVEDKNWKKIRPILEEHFPEILEKFEEIIFSTDHAYWKELRQHLKNIKIDLKIEI